MLDATVTAQSRLQTPEQFRNIIVKSDPSGARVLLSDVARVELGAENYSATIRINGHPGAGIGIYLEPGANALTTSKLVKARWRSVAAGMPAGYEIAYANDSSDFIRLSVIEVVKTLAEAMALVILVMFVFLQSWRATLIPGIAIPVVLLGTFGMLYILGFSINTLTLFGLVLAVGLLVDDAIVVVENVERILHEQPELTTKEATIISMQPDPDGAGRDRSGALGGVPADGLLRRFDRRHLSPVLGDDRLGDGAVGAARARPSARRLRRTCSGGSTRVSKRPGSASGRPRVAHAIETARQTFNDRFQRLDRLVCRQRRQGRRSQMAVPCHLRGRVRCC